MPEQQPYDEAVRCLERYGYDVLPDPPGYLVSLHSKPADVSRARHLADLVDFAELFEWAAQRPGHGTTT